MSNEAKEIIRVENLECRYGDETILRDITFGVKREEIFFIAGRSGCGKTTLLSNMVGLRNPSRGRVTYFGRDFTGADSVDRMELVKSFGLLFQNNALWSDMSLAENVALPLVLHTRLPVEIRREIVSLKLAQVGLAGQKDRLPHELSGGMQKRAALARALALDPSILFFDEPTAGLDPITAAQIDDLILEVRKTSGATIVIVSHSLASIFHIADRMILLGGDGKNILAEGSPEKLAAETGNAEVHEFLRLRVEIKPSNTPKGSDEAARSE
ncbi:MAG TPA: ATP-binding cassette domain-containing protein [Verrucomicrobiae bacterium]|jgi:phospholipid/cholesterol/gamma-HCH transport system ATP-binding protein|nr:ATP-binding cassette domain-containing protein [Verrucomicrobiae bacterium]